MCSTPEALVKPLPQGVRLGSTKKSQPALASCLGFAGIEAGKLLRRLVAEPDSKGQGNK